MVRQNHHGIHAERMPRLHRLERRTQGADMFDKKPVPPPFCEIDREKPGGAGNIGAAVFRHGTFVFAWTRGPERRT